METWAAIPDLWGANVGLRALVESDIPALLEAFADNPPLPMTIVPGPATIGPWFDKLMREKAAGRVFPFTVLDAEGRVSGTTRYLRMSPAHRRLEIGGTLYARRVQRTALNTEAKFLLLRHAFETLGCNVVQLRTDVLNARSRTAIERLGAKPDGILRAHMIMPGGRVRDTVVYSIVAAEWPAARERLEGLMRR
jgi:RimJ/RimL family protein N-acetyltransferase